MERKNSPSKSDKWNNRYFLSSFETSAKPHERNAKYNANPGTITGKNINFRHLPFFFPFPIYITILRA